MAKPFNHSIVLVNSISSEHTASIGLFGAMHPLSASFRFNKLLKINLTLKINTLFFGMVRERQRLTLH
jgi:hypothetical protein|tara:strand:+ start:2859 stop:3062 length:204 start_codon:yes stop_codon:yes gene_type:complete